MRAIVHISDLHFGRTNAAVLPVLAAAIRAEQPDLVVVSGDLTQRARKRQFQEARRFLSALPQPQIVVPGNHDIPLYNPVSRWLEPLAKYRKYISEDLEPFYSDEEIAVAGINTARSWSFKEGRINERQVALSCARLSSTPGALIRIVVTHHPFSVADVESTDGIIGRAAMAMTGFATCRVDMILSGHMHLSHSTSSAARYSDSSHAALLVQAGTASSSRHRGERNSFNIVRVSRPDITVERRTWDDSEGTFKSAGTDHFRWTAAGWAVPAEAGT
jgi:3',5'-cyclic AMP phosphodiesterase CpdA